MTYRWLTDLDQALSAGGVPYVEVGPSSADPTGAASWRTRGRPYSTGNFDPTGILCHHTASSSSSSDQADLNVILYGNGSAPGPISQLLIGREPGATVYLVAAGRANHGGKGAIPGESCSDMNGRLLGIEVSNNGTGEWWTDELCDRYAAVVRALCDWYGWTLDDVYCHSTTGPPCGNYKIDPAGPCSWWPQGGTWDLEAWRAYIAADASPPEPPTSKEEFVIKLIQVAGTQTTFIGYVQEPGPYILWCQWAWGEIYERWMAVGTPSVLVTREQLRSATLLGPVPSGDPPNDWSSEWGRDFACTVQ